MLDANDVRMFEQMFDQKLGEVRSEIQGLRSEMHQGFDEVGKEFMKVRAEMARGFEKVRIEIRDDIIDVIDQNIQPQLTSAVSRITRLERKLA